MTDQLHNRRPRPPKTETWYKKPERYHLTLPHGYVTVRQAAAMLGVNVSTLSEWIRRLKIPFLYRFYQISLTHRLAFRYKILPRSSVLILLDYLYGQTFRRIARLTRRPIPPLCQQLYETATHGKPFTMPPNTSSPSTTNASTAPATTPTSSKPRATRGRPRRRTR